ncbi:MAG TPA: glycosyltransferase family 4 protein [Opitutaceae bacterium]|jgi:glycosyltransferase involved in cell wall biosynthesis
MNQPSHYQTVFFREIANRKTVRLSVIYAAGLAENRKMLGWEEPRLEEYEQTVLKGPFRVKNALLNAWRHRRAVHLFNGVWSVPVFVLCSTLLILVGAEVYFHSERPNPAHSREGFWGKLKRIWVKMVFRRAKGIFVIGRLAGAFYRGVGVPSEKIIPFMYFNRGLGRLPADRQTAKPFTIIYVGQFVARKRVEDLIEAFGIFRNEMPNARLILVGSGPLRDAYAVQAANLRITDVLKMTGPLPPQDVALAIQCSDVLVLPSAFDGWGLTVNEALQAGVPAICSDCCGAAELLENRSDWGLVYSSGNIAQLVSAIRNIASIPARYCPDPDEVESIIGPTALTREFLRAALGPR